MEKIVLFARIREVLRVSTQLAAFIASRAGAIVRRVRPGLIEADLSSDIGVAIRVRPINIYEGEAAAYIAAGRPVPAQVFVDLARWKKEHGG